MNRREFLRILSSVGVGLSCGIPVSSKLYAANDNYQGPLWIMVNADGGWDVTSLCDPKGYKGALDASNPDRVNNYDAADIGVAGNLQFAPPPMIYQQGGALYDPSIFTAQQFYTKYYQDLLVINGIDSLTNSHNDGQLHNFSGRLRVGYPSFGALVAGSIASNLPLSFLTNGGYSHTADLVTPVRMRSSELKAIFEIAYPNRSLNPKSSSSRTYVPDSLLQLIEQTSEARHSALLSEQTLPRIQNAIKNIIKSRRDVAQLQGFADNLENIPSVDEANFNGRKNAFRLYQQGRIALAAYQQGLTSSVNLRLGGFDTHAKHDENHYPLLMDLLQGVDAIIDEATARGLRDKIVVVMASDFGRTNKFNKDAGKDHWPIGSAMLLGNSRQFIRGNRQVGATTERHEALNIDPNTLMPDNVGTNQNAVRLTPGHLHLALRNLAGILDSGPSLAYPIELELLDLLS